MYIVLIREFESYEKNEVLEVIQDPKFKLNYITQKISRNKKMPKGIRLYARDVKIITKKLNPEYWL